MESFICFPGEKICADATAKPTFGKRTITEFSRNVMRKMTCLGTKRWSFTADHQIFGAKVEILFRSFHWKIPGTNGNSEKVVPFSRLGRSEWKFIYHFQVSLVSYWFHVVTRIQSSAVRQSGNFTEAPNVNFRKIYFRKTIWDLEFSEHFL